MFDKYRLLVVTRRNSSKLPVFCYSYVRLKNIIGSPFSCTNTSLFPYCTLYTANYPRMAVYSAWKRSNSIEIFIPNFFFSFYGLRRIFVDSTTCQRVYPFWCYPLLSLAECICFTDFRWPCLHTWPLGLFSFTFSTKVFFRNLTVNLHTWSARSIRFLVK